MIGQVFEIVDDPPAHKAVPAGHAVVRLCTVPRVLAASSRCSTALGRALWIVLGIFQTVLTVLARERGLVRKALKCINSD